MAEEQLPLDEATVRFKDNEVRFDLFINDAVGYLTREGVSVESIIAFLARLELEILGYQALGPRVGTLETDVAALDVRVTAIEDLDFAGLESRVDDLETDVTELKRGAESPSEWISYLPIGADHLTPSLSAGVLTKLLIPTTVKFSNEFAIVDIGGGDMRVQYQGAVARRFAIHANTGLQTGTSNTVVKLRMYKGTVATPDVAEPGVGITRKVGTGTDTGALGFAGEFILNPLDVVAVAAESSLTSTLIFIETSIIITETRG